MSFDCFDLGNSLYLNGSGDLAVKLAADSRISHDSNGLYLDDDEKTTDWIDFTPIFYPLGLNLGNGTTYGRYMRFGQIIYFHVSLVFGTTTSVGSSGQLYFQPPVRPANWGQAGTSNQPIAWTLYGPFFVGQVGQASTSWPQYLTTGTLQVGGSDCTAGNITTTVPFTWGTGSAWVANGFYERY